jgi:hypothetical protein
VFAWSQVAIGLVLLHCFWLFFFLVGSLTLGRLPLSGSTERNASGSLTELVTASATGIAVTGLYGFIVGVTGLFQPWSLLVLIVFLALLAHVRGVRVLASDFWHDRAAVIAGAFRWPSAIVYALGIVIAVPAALPEIAADPNTIHLPYALEWARAHSLTVDPYFRFPYYAMNWQLLYAWLFLLNLGNWTPLLSALCGVLSGLGIQAALAPRIWRQDSGHGPPAAVGSILLVAAPLMLFLSPTFLRWNVTSMIDIPIAFLFLATALLAVKALEGGADRETLARLILCGGFFIGLKPTFLTFVPLLAVLVWLVAKNAMGSKRGAAAAVLLFVVTASPWYVKSFVQDGDPIAPYLNLAIVHKDAKFSVLDWSGITRDLSRGRERDPLSLIKLPVRMFLHTNTERFREYGVTFGLVGLYLPLIFLWFALVSQKHFFLNDRRLLIFAVCASYGVVYWVATSYLARYSLLFTPALCVCLGLWLFYLSRRGRFAAAAAVALGLICAVPTPTSTDWLAHLALANYRYLPDIYKSRSDYLDRSVLAYKEEEYISRFESAPGRAKRVLGLCCHDLAFQFKVNGVTQIGDYVGPERFGDVVIAIHENQIARFVNRFGVDAILVRRGEYFSSHEVDELIDEAKRLGFRLGPVFDPRNVILLKENSSQK